MKRNIVHIDAEKCNGCGLCVPACAEGAIQIIDGKARLVGDRYCDGLGACLGECPKGAISIEEKEVEPFDEESAKKHIGEMKHKEPLPCGCQGTMVQFFESKDKEAIKNIKIPSELISWPIQLKLVPPVAPFLKHSNLLIAADCVPFAYANFHRDLLKGRVLIICCPKLDEVQPQDAEFYQSKLTEIFKLNAPKSVLVAHMEVPCCFGLVSIVKNAIKSSGQNIPFSEVTLGIKGEMMQREVK
ncbi:MAG: 4Fe-4S binding protein [Candidatus Stahlbacteria bacterium]|nr:4Fe-4S binding protein [Candidatus Stahlbacteria bacterium]